MYGPNKVMDAADTQPGLFPPPRCENYLLSYARSIGAVDATPGRGDFWILEIAGNPGGSPEATRRAFNKRFLLDLAEDWQQHGREVFKRVRRESPAAYLKVCAMLVPREMKLEHSGGVK